MRTKAIVVDISLPSACERERGAAARAAARPARGACAARARQRAAERGAARAQVAHLGAVVGRA